MKYTPDFSSRFRILKGGKISLVVSALVAGSTMTFASPTGGQVTSGSAAIAQNGSITTINQSSNKASINWNSFSIAPSETVNFVQPSAQSVTLNRVVGTTQSLIQGAMNANGQVFLLNPNGVLFANGSQVNVGGLVASTLNITDENFQAGNYLFEGNSQNSIINMGTITANNGYVAMMGKTVQNEGTIVATMGNVQMASGEKISLNLNGNSLVKLTIDQGTLNALVENKGLIQADGGQVYLTTQALNTILDGMVNNTGIIEAQTLNDVTGKIVLFAHGGTANIGGTLDASALVSGDGGFIETSGKEISFADDFSVHAGSTSGKSGTWLVDPTNILINGASFCTGTNCMTGAQINTVLASGTNVMIATDIEGADAGDITLEGVTINPNNSDDVTFKLQSHHDIIFRDFDGTMTAISQNTLAGGALHVVLVAGNAINLNKATIDVKNGSNITLTAANGITIEGFSGAGTKIQTDGGIISLLNGTSSASAANGIKIHDYANLKQINAGTGTINIESYVASSETSFNLKAVQIEGTTIDARNITIKGIQNSAYTPAMYIDLGGYGAKIGEHAQSITFEGKATNMSSLEIAGDNTNHSTSIGGSLLTTLNFFVEGNNGFVDTIFMNPDPSSHPVFNFNASADVTIKPTSGLSFIGTSSANSDGLFVSVDGLAFYDTLFSGASKITIGNRDTITAVDNIPSHSKTLILEGREVYAGIGDSAVTWNGNLGVYATNAVVQNQAIISNGSVVFVATDSITLNNPDNNFNTISLLSLGDIELNEADGFTLGDITSRVSIYPMFALMANNVSLNTGGSIVQGTDTFITANDATFGSDADIVVGNMNITGDLSITSNTGEILQESGTSIITAPTSIVSLQAGPDQIIDGYVNKKIIALWSENVAYNAEAGTYSYVPQTNEIYNLKILGGSNAYIGTSKDINLLTSQTGDLYVVSDKGISITGNIGVTGTYSEAVLFANSTAGYDVVFTNNSHLYLNGPGIGYSIYSHSPHDSHISALPGTSTPSLTVYSTNRDTDLIDTLGGGMGGPYHNGFTQKELVYASAQPTPTPEPQPEPTPHHHTPIEDVVTTIVNQSVIVPQNITPPLSPRVEQQSPQMQTALNSLLPTQNSDDFSLVSTTDGNGYLQLLSMNDIKKSLPSGSEIRVPLGHDSVVELINGGVNLPDGVSQEFYVVKKSK